MVTRALFQLCDTGCRSHIMGGKLTEIMRVACTAPHHSIMTTMMEAC
jgi:hypothetical protein